jgi:hypothetical protein
MSLRPNLRLDQKRRPRARSPLAAAPATDRQSFLVVEPLGLPAVHAMAFGTQQHVQMPVAQTALPGSQLAQPLPQCSVIWPAGSGADHLAIRPDDLTRPPLAHLAGRGEMGDSLPPGGGRQRFL